MLSGILSAESKRVSSDIE